MERHMYHRHSNEFFKHPVASDEIPSSLGTPGRLSQEREAPRLPEVLVVKK